MNELININYDTDKPTVSGRELHKALEVKDHYTDWFKRMTEYGFTEGEDFIGFSEKSDKPTGGRPSTDHQLTIPMAKEICMLQRNDKGKQFRQYFIRVEEAWNSPEMIMKRALDYANENVKRLQIQVSTLQVDNEIMKPKADYFDELVDRNTLIDAQVHPEAHKDLVIRVAGYSAHFTKLAKETQDNIIARTEMEF